MKFKKTKTAALALATLLAAGSFSGCALVTNNLKKDLEQVVASVDITDSEDYSSLKGTITASSVLKRDLVASFASVGSTYVNSYGMAAADVYEMLKNQLVNRQIYIQYAQAYFLGDDSSKKAAWDSAIAAADESEKSIAAIAYFLDKDEIAAAEYSVKTSLNDALDSQEVQYIDAEADEHDHDTARTTPTGVNTVSEDYYDPAYQIYTGFNHASDCGSYEAQDGSTPSTRMKAYKSLLSNLNYYGLVSKGENTSDITKLEYYNSERKSAYETQLINKLGDVFEKEAKEKITKEWMEGKYQTTLDSQKEQFGTADASALESALDGVSDSSFVLYAPENYGFVINILLPFSTQQTQELNDSEADYGDPKGNKFVKRASLLEGITATDQRNTWFTGHDDFSYVATDEDGAYTAGSADRKYLFFEDSMKKTEEKDGVPAQYEKIPNYLGKYTYNGTVFQGEDEDGDKEYTFRPNKITIDDFIQEMEGYLNFAGLHLTGATKTENYYNRTFSDYYQEDGTVDYSSFLYYKAKVEELGTFNANNIFKEGSVENKALSVINELSFAYNTDTAGLNTYLGYAVSPNNTDFVKEFEYAAQEAVRGGAGTITVAPSDYGWHIMYCTFSYTGNTVPYTFNWDEIEVEGTFSNLYYEALTAENFSSYSSELQTTVLNKYNNDTCVTVYEKRYQDLFEA